MVTGIQEDRHAAAQKVKQLAARRVVVASVQPSIDGGDNPIKRVLGEDVVVEADLIADGHDLIAGRVLFRAVGEEEWRHVAVTSLNNDRYGAAFRVDRLGLWEYRVEGWVDELASFQRALERKLAGGEDADVVSHLRQGEQLFLAVAMRCPEPDRERWRAAAKALSIAEAELPAALSVAQDRQFAIEAAQRPDPRQISGSAQTFQVVVEPERARFSAWYEFFPRSFGPPGQHGSFRDCEAQLEYVASLGFDVVYLPPIHPIGLSHRKGKNNSTVAQPGEPGSPWAIGAAEGGHKDIHPALGSLDDFRWFVERARGLGLEVAMDIAFQASPDHPYVRTHPEWFVRRPDGTIQYAENPPKKYQDIYPFDFESVDAPGLFQELLSVFEYWVEQGVRIFRVDNPHTKSLPFWRYCIRELKRGHPDVILLAEAFTRPKLMYQLAKLGFSQSYTYFTWRNSARELTEYLTELTQTEVAEFCRPNFWPNTPDILPEHLQFGGRPAFVARLVLAATLGSNYGIYGPAYELMEHVARPGSGEYVDNEKYELKSWDLDAPHSLRSVIQRINGIRRQHAALQGMRSLRFHACDNEALLCYSKRDEDHALVMVVNLDFHHTQSGWLQLDLPELDLHEGETYQVHDLLCDGRYLWTGPRNYVELDPRECPAHIFRIRKHIRTEHDFDYFV